MKRFDPAAMDLADFYKTGHFSMYPKDMEFLQSNWTPRGSRVEGVDQVVFYGLQSFIQHVVEDEFGRLFTDEGEQMILDHQSTVATGLGAEEFNVQHWAGLRELGYMPLKFSALPEGTEVPLRVPMFKVENTVPGYGWLVNYIESILSNNIWQGMTSATIALKFRRMLDHWAGITSDTPEFVDWQGHDFSFRGMSGLESAAMSGSGHLLCFAGTDTLPAIKWVQAHYEAGPFVGGSVLATEHSVMCAGGKENEIETTLRLLRENPTGILSVVFDTWDLWHVLTKILSHPEVKAAILARDGTLVIRPDSGDPVDILCGNPEGRSEAEIKGVVQLLYEEFGGDTNSKGYKTLDSHVGTIYGDAITFSRADAICRRLAYKGYASTIPVLGIGSFTYQYNTRDTFGFAMKATWCQRNGVGQDLFKDPVTDSGLKRSARGRVAVGRDERENLVLINGASEQAERDSLLKPVWENGHFHQTQTFNEIAARLGVRKLLPA